MSWSIRARLTAWYSLVVVAVLITSALAVAVVARRTAGDRLDGELQRLMMTLDGVMRTEFREGLTIEASAEEASTEVVAPDRVLVLTRAEGELLQMWGLPFAQAWRPDPAQSIIDTVVIDGRRLRRFSHPVTYGQYRYVSAVLAPLEELESAQEELVEALAIGGVLALFVAIAGGWIVGQQTLKPLTKMAGQAAAITEHDPTGRLTAPNSGDELGRFAASFNGLLDRLVGVLHAQRQFMADASHELRTPVSVIRTTSQVTMARDGRQEADYRESLTIVSEQSARLTRLVDAMFLLSRAEAQGLPLMPEPLYLDDVVGECVRALRVVAAERGVVIELTGTADMTYSGDNMLLRQMVGNLLDNALRHASSRVAVGITSSPLEICITTTNDGDSIPSEQHERIFHRFVRLDSQSRGAGLGLPIARRIAEAHGGRLTLESSVAGATTFLIVLPIT